MKPGKSFLKKNKIWLALIAGMLGIHILYMFLEGLSLEELLYAAMLEVCLILAVCIALFVREQKKIKHLENSQRALLSGQPEFEEPKDRLEEIYQQMIETEDIARKMAESANLQQQVEMKDYYACWVHQIKTPIAALRLLLQSQKNDLQEVPGDQEEVYCKQYQSLSDMEEELFRIEEYVNMALQYQRLQSGSNDFVLEKISLDRMIRDGIHKYARTMIRKKIRVQYEGCEDMVLTDEKWMVFVIGQILSNAVKYTLEGEISLSVHHQGIWVYLRIQDTGIGIRSEDIPRVFERGYTGFNGRSDKKSTGIGLYLCQKILKKLGHTIRLESQAGEGTSVWIGFRKS